MFDNIIEDIVNNKMPIVLYIYSTRLLIDSNTLEFFKNLKYNSNNKIALYIIDIDLNSQILSEFEITTIPAVICFKNNKEYFRFTGTQTKNQLKTILSLIFK